MCTERDRIAMRVHLCVIEVVVALGITGEPRVISLRRKDERSPATPAAHQFCSEQFLCFACRASMLTKKFAKGGDVFLQSAISHIAAISRQNFGLRQFG